MRLEVTFVKDTRGKWGLTPPREALGCAWVLASLGGVHPFRLRPGQPDVLCPCECGSPFRGPDAWSCLLPHSLISSHLSPPSTSLGCTSLVSPGSDIQTGVLTLGLQEPSAMYPRCLEHGCVFFQIGPFSSYSATGLHPTEVDPEHLVGRCGFSPLGQGRPHF